MFHLLRVALLAVLVLSMSGQAWSASPNASLPRKLVRPPLGHIKAGPACPAPTSRAAVAAKPQPVPRSKRPAPALERRLSFAPADKPASAADTPATEPSASQDAPPADDEQVIQRVGMTWHTSYDEAMRRAARERKMLFIFFHDGRRNAASCAFQNRTLADSTIKQQLGGYVLAMLHRSAKVNINGSATRLLAHPAFAEMLGQQGIAIVDLAHSKTEYFGRVVSTFPFTPGKYYVKQAVAIILALPPGTLTQRTMIYAVRIHPEAPASTSGRLHPVLVAEAKQQSKYQAAITVQGHHNWESRFHSINARLPGGVMAQEVVAESWPNEGLVEACVDCVHSWRQSPGHWGAVRSRHPLFGYDIKRGRNGIWYATGIFGRR